MKKLACLTLACAMVSFAGCRHRNEAVPTVEKVTDVSETRITDVRQYDIEHITLSLDTDQVLVNGSVLGTIPIRPDTDYYYFPLRDFHNTKVKFISDSVVSLRVPNGPDRLSWGVMPGGYQRQGDQGFFPISVVNMGGMVPNDTVVNKDGSVTFHFNFLEPGSYFMVNPFTLRIAPFTAEK